MSTLLSDSSAYATPADFTARFDTRDVQQWVSDTGTPAGSGTLATNAPLLAALADASGMIESACLASDRYLITDLQVLAAGSGNSSAFLRRLVCDIAVGLLMERRVNLDRDPPAQYLRALEWLDALRSGHRIFAFSEVADAGNPKVTVQSGYDIANRNLASFQAARYFGADRAEEFVPGSNPGGGSNVVP